jgi:2Fe-2S ferredoxin
MAEIVYQTPDGATHVIDVPEGQTVMEGALRNNLPGIYADCGGNVSCATCHVYVAPEFGAHFEPVSSDERDMLDFTAGVSEFSRLSCQLTVTGGCAGARVQISATNG